MNTTEQAERDDVTFESGGDQVAAWWYRPGAGTVPDGGAAPCVVMAHGFSLTRHDGLPAYAEALAAAGVHVLVFDHRYLGDSGGTPRLRFRAAAQRQDWDRAIAHARTLDGVDPQRIVLWGFSFSGGHVATLMAGRDDIAAAILVCPFLDGLKRVLATPPRLVAWILPRAVRDAVGGHNLIPVTGAPGERAAMTLPGEADGFASAVPPGSPWRNEISPGLFATVALFRPVSKAKRITVPVWLALGERDVSADGPAIERFASRSPHAELHRYDVDHFEPFFGDRPARIAADQVAFLRAQGFVA